MTSNLRPGRSLRQYAEDYTFLAACKQAGGNLLLGAPFGILLPILVPRRLRMIRMTVLTVLVISVVELVQGALVAGRAFDVDDVILNTAGALRYALLGRRLSHHYHALSDEQPAVETARTTPRPSAGSEPGSSDKVKPDPRPKSGTATKTGTKAKPVTRVKAGTEAKAGTKAKPGTKPKAAGASKDGDRTGSKAKPAAEPAARLSASAQVARGRALLDRWRSRREGPGGGAPGARRRGA